MMKQCRNCLLYLLTMIILVVSSCTLSFPREFPRDPSIEPELYIPDFSTILGDSWYMGEIEIATVNDDFKGYSPSLVYRADQSTYHTESDFPLLPYTILIYEDAESALERYRIQDEMLFYDLPRDPNKWFDISTENIHNADRYHTACEEGTSESVGRWRSCIGIFLYGQTVVVLRVRPISYDVRYFPDDLVQELFQAIDNLLGQ